MAALRRRKHREAKPFAVMVADLAAARPLAEVDRREAELLTSPQRPIVLLRRRQARPADAGRGAGQSLPRASCCRTPRCIICCSDRCPDRPAPVPSVLVMTSGNLTDEPICYEDADARHRLGPIADCWLVHDRPIHVPCDDSVVRVEEGEELPIRRSRGYAPLPVRLPFDVAPTLATGGELKNTFCLASGRDAWMSQHIGDMGSVETLAAFERSIEQFAAMYDGPSRSGWPRTAIPATSPAAGPRIRAGDRPARSWCSTTMPTSPRSWPNTACRPSSG